MSLELALAENTATLKQLIVILQSGGALPAALASTAVETAAASPAPAAEKKTRTSKTTAAGGPETNSGQKVSVKLVDGHPEGTRYFHIPQHKTVAAVKPGEVIPEIEGTTEISGDGYLELKEKYAEKKPETAATTSTASSQPQGASAEAGAASEIAFDDVMKKMVELSNDKRETCGRAGVKAILDKYKAAKVPELKSLEGQYAAILADINALLNPEAATTGAAAEDDLF